MRMAEAGLDGAELTASHGMLIAQFLNPLTNFREINTVARTQSVSPVTENDSRFGKGG